MKRWKDPEIRQLHLSPIEKSVDNFQTYLAVRYLVKNRRSKWFPIPGSATGTAEVVSPEIGKIYQGNYNYTCDFNKK
ncbi:hypothetical protein HBH56_041220 [Parastagonospora nodorum]|nr:hypothetical protein HBH56_041220 [Parastagonospora nodorum]KAH3933219.1 hypothetical protein HBH54_068970 [Parastagonospora nodorum]KAH3943390.1 hypothetical protein HBH53_173140 [Parastagonospora nodorum]KAH3980618.1 hypothetical protein HBH51_046970 [Parastagonospora nodorum]KAH4004389.1 hypothetical protein HBI10_048050 [Parastagonospora nodorum]